MEKESRPTSQLETFSDEVFFEIFDRLSPSDLYKTFAKLNGRFKTILNDSRMRFRDNLSSMNAEQFHFYVQSVLPHVLDRLISLTIGTYDTDEVRSSEPNHRQCHFSLLQYQQVNLFLHAYSIDLARFKHLRTLVIIKMPITDVYMVQSACKQMQHLVNVRLSVDSNDVNASSFVSIENDFFVRPTLKRAKMDMCARTTFQNVTECSHVEQLSIAWCQMQELTHLLLYVPDLHTLRASICGLDDGKSPEALRHSTNVSHRHLVETWTQTIQEIPSHRFPLGLKSLKLVVDSMRFDTLLLLLDKLTQLRALWLLLDEHDYLDVEKWQTLFQSSLSQVDQLDLTIALTYPFPTVVIPGQILIYSAPHVACTKFNGKFWLDRGWRAKINEYDYCVRLTVSNDAAPS